VVATIDCPPQARWQLVEVRWCPEGSVTSDTRGAGSRELRKVLAMSAPTIDIQPNTNGLPGLGALENMVGALLTFGLVAAVAGVAISAIAWAIGSHSSNPHVAGKGKTGVLVAGGAALLIGAANALVTFFSNVGQSVH